MIYVKKTLRMLFYIFFSMQLFACSSWGVKPWEREQLAEKEMQLSEPNLDLSFDDHVYFSKEAVSGGRGFSGGGCGCN